MGLLNENASTYYSGSDYGSYQFITIKDIVNNFMVAYVGEGKLIPKAKRTDVGFHAQRAIQEFSFDTLPSTKAIEIDLGPALTMTLPQDYVNYINFSWTDNAGIQHIIYPTRDTGNAVAPLQDSNFNYTFDSNGILLEAEESSTVINFKNANTGADISDKSNLSDADIFELYRYGNRYGIDPERTQGNGVFYIDQLKGVARFSSNLSGQIITLKYISDGLATDEEMKVHKFAEEAMYKCIAYAILSGKRNIPEYIINRLRKEKFAETRKAKLRLSNIKLEELTQVLRGKSKWIKH